MITCVRFILLMVFLVMSAYCGLKAGEEPGEDLSARQKRYGDFPPFRGISYPPLPEKWSAA